MDVTILRNRIQSTVDPNADVRRQAELDLRYVSFLVLLFPECAKMAFSRQKNNLVLPMLFSTYCRRNRRTAYASPVRPSGLAVNKLIYLQLLYTSKTESLEHGNRARIL